MDAPVATPPEHLISACGIDCTACEVFQATKNNDEELRRTLAAKFSKLWGKPVRPSQIECHGCKGRLDQHFEADCRLLVCATERGYAHCFQCPDYGVCEHYDWFRSLKVPSHPQIISVGTLMGTLGVDEWKRRAKVAQLLNDVGVKTETVVPPPMAIERKAARLNPKIKRMSRQQIQKKARLWQDALVAKLAAEEEGRKAAARAKSKAEAEASRATKAGLALPPKVGAKAPLAKAAATAKAQRPTGRAAATKAAAKHLLRAKASVVASRSKTRPKGRGPKRRDRGKATPKARPARSGSAKKKTSAPKRRR